jgi:hypothetical protein
VAAASVLPHRFQLHISEVDMELGLALPTSGPQTSPETIVKVAKEAERLGYSALWSPFLGGSPKEVAQDLAAAREAGASQVYFAGGQGLGVGIGLNATDVDEWLGLLGELIQAAGELDVLAD